VHSAKLLDKIYVVTVNGVLDQQLQRAAMMIRAYSIHSDFRFDSQMLTIKVDFQIERNLHKKLKSLPKIILF